MQQTLSTIIYNEYTTLSGENYFPNKIKIGSLFGLGIIASLSLQNSQLTNVSIYIPQNSIKQEIVNSISQVNTSETLRRNIEDIKYSFLKNKVIDEDSFVYSYNDV